ncbi:uncharacterized protein A4U43_C02F9220 [Asparagus officinalis]|uniref:Uncharacterized protein n=1 Tax=Asparagus officinalis TaxID=4686 RepID=A0A5P1FL35_ASPOF|nr:uncharacterized protein LOC109830478 [Asparagus officinalis]ONK77669.1 uncharacterized protein A4U43_C02F9220 [Asparagus officinalis]
MKKSSPPQQPSESRRTLKPPMALASSTTTSYKNGGFLEVVCRKRDRDRDQRYPYQVVEITPPPRHLGVRCLPMNIHCGESVTIEGQMYTVSAVTHRYQLRKGKYEPSEKRLDVQSTGRYILNLYLDNLLEKS